MSDSNEMSRGTFPTRAVFRIFPRHFDRIDLESSNAHLNRSGHSPVDR
jgi:hypothetical protein